MTPETKTELIQQVFDAINAREWDRYADYHSKSFVIHGWEADITLDDWVDSMHESMLHAFPDLQFHPDDLFAADDRVIMRYHVTGTHKDTYKGVEATGTNVSYPGIAIFRIEGGAVAEVWPVFDGGVLLEQIGAIPAAR